MHYWLATTRPDGRPHVVPLDGLWLDDAWFFGGSAETVKYRNLKANPRAVVHLDDSERAVIVEGRCEEIVLGRAARRPAVGALEVEVWIRPRPCQLCHHRRLAPATRPRHQLAAISTRCDALCVRSCRLSSRAARSYPARSERLRRRGARGRKGREGVVSEHPIGRRAALAFVEKQRSEAGQLLLVQAGVTERSGGLSRSGESASGSSRCRARRSAAASRTVLWTHR
jgi:Pyridoxamine 5'-phosphate oxidase